MGFWYNLYKLLAEGYLAREDYDEHCRYAEYHGGKPTMLRENKTSLSYASWIIFQERPNIPPYIIFFCIVSIVMLIILQEKSLL